MNFCLEIPNVASTERAATFGDWVLEKRNAHNWTQDQLLARAGNIITKSYLSQLENNRSNSKSGEPIRPSLDKVDALAAALEASVNEARQLAGHPPSETEMSRDEVADRFTFVLAKYRQLAPESRDYVDKQIEMTLDFALHLQKKNVAAVGGADPSEKSRPAAKHSQEVHFITEEQLNRMQVITRTDLRRKYEEKKGKKK